MNTNKFKPNAPRHMARSPRTVARLASSTLLVQFSDGSRYQHSNAHGCGNFRRVDEDGNLIPRVRMSKKQRLRQRGHPAYRLN